MENLLFIAQVIIVVLSFVVWFLIDIVRDQKRKIKNQKNIIETQIKDMQSAENRAQMSSEQLRYVLRRMNPKEAHQLKDEVSEKENDLPKEAMFSDLGEEIKSIIDEKCGY